MHIYIYTLFAILTGLSVVVVVSVRVWVWVFVVWVWVWVYIQHDFEGSQYHRNVGCMVQFLPVRIEINKIKIISTQNGGCRRKALRKGTIFKKKVAPERFLTTIRSICLPFFRIYFLRLFKPNQKY